MMQFHSVELTDRERIEALRRTYGGKASIYLFSSLYIWKHELSLSVCIQGDCFTVRAACAAGNVYFFPCGSDEAKLRVIRTLLRAGRVEFCNMSADDCAFLDRHFPGRFHSWADRDSWEYLYDRSEQIALSGSGFKTVRKKINAGEKRGPWEVVPLCAQNTALAAAVTKKWMQLPGKRGFADADATLLALSSFEELALEGIVLQKDGLPHAFAVGTIYCRDIFNLKLSKTIDSDIDWYLKWELYRHLPDTIRLINREDDMGIAGLRTHKTEMKPCGFIELYRSIVL